VVLLIIVHDLDDGNDNKCGRIGGDIDGNSAIGVKAMIAGNAII